jgi:cytochrome c553
MSSLYQAAALAVGLVACSPHEPPPTPAAPLGDHHAAPPTMAATPALDRPLVVRAHMQSHFDDLREIERLLVAGRLGDAKALAYLLTIPATDPGLSSWRADQQPVATAARAIEDASTLEAGIAGDVAVARACAACHARSGARALFAAAPSIPKAAGTDGEMARHAWAADRLWEGLIGGADASWSMGLELLAESSTLPPGPAADRLSDLARVTLLRAGPSDTNARAGAYEQLLDACLGCHATRGTAQ